jgi:hypothetical protein
MPPVHKISKVHPHAHPIKVHCCAKIYIIKNKLYRGTKLYSYIYRADKIGPDVA